MATGSDTGTASAYSSRPFGGVSEHFHKGLKFMDTNPLSGCQILRVCFEPYRGYMSSRLEVSGDKWEHKARIREARLSGSDEPLRRPHMHPLQLAAHNILENRFHVATMKFFEPDMYHSIIKKEDITIANNVFAFQLTSSVDAAVRDIITEANEQLPISMFKLEHDPSYVDFVMAMPKCLRDDWSSAHIDTETTIDRNGLLNPHARQKRLQICRIATMDRLSLTIGWQSCR